MVTTASIARVAALIGDPTRASMLQALMEGRALTAAELAGVARVAPQTASGHLAQLTTAGLVTVARPGRHRYHRLRDAAGGAYALILSQNQVDSSAHRSRSAPLERKRRKRLHDGHDRQAVDVEMPGQCAGPEDRLGDVV